MNDVYVKLSYAEDQLKAGKNTSDSSKLYHIKTDGAGMVSFE